MPKCSVCNKTQSKLNKPGKLCKSCFKGKNASVNESDALINDSQIDDRDNKSGDNSDMNTVKEIPIHLPSQERSVLDIVKEFMLEDKLKEIELIDIMKEHIQFLQSVIKGKEREIESLIERIPRYYNRNVNTQANCDSQSCVETSCEMSCDTSNIESTPSTNKESITHNPKETFVSEYTKWHIVGDKNKKRKKT